ncbi:MAG: HEPN domain-containing protein [Anaerolineae bacterium]
MQRLAQSNLADARRRLQVARDVFQEEAYHFSVRLCQEAVELALKAALRYVNVDPPKWHDVGEILLQNAHKFPDWFRRDLKRLAAVSKELRGERELSMYGDEERGMPAEELYGEKEAIEAVQGAEQVLAACEKLIMEEEIEAAPEGEITPEEGADAA